jgi:predicted cupin superfamily sugar epimerase
VPPAPDRSTVTATDAEVARRVADLVAALDLEAHPEGGWYRRTWEHPEAVDGRALGSAIVYLLGPGERSHWHRFDAAELWHLYEGGPLELSISLDGVVVERHVLGPDLGAGQRRQVAVPPGAWQSARLVDGDGYAFIGCTVTPAFRFEHHELAPPGWAPG